MKKELTELDFSNDIDIIYAYKNIRTNPELLESLATVKISSFDFGMLCFDVIAGAVLEELDETFVDEEMLGMLQKCTKIEEEQSQSKIYCEKLNLLLSPLVNVCNKQIVDLVYFVYKKSGISHFGFLFESFKVDTHKIELHLLAAKGIKARSFDLTELKQFLVDSNTTKNENTAHGEDKDTDTKTDNEDSVKDKSNETPFLEDKENNVSFQSDSSDDAEAGNSTRLLSRPFRDGVVEMDPTFHLSKAKELLLMTNKYSDSVFMLENIANFLALKFDREIFEKFLLFSEYPHFHIALNKLPDVPFFFYEGADIRRILGSIPKDKNNDTQASITTGDSIPEIKVNSTLLKLYMEFANKTLTSLESPDIDYLLLARGLRSFVFSYKSPALLKIFTDLLRCKISSVLLEIEDILLPDLDLYLDAFVAKPMDHPECENQVCPSMDDPFPVLLNAYLNSSFYSASDDAIAWRLLNETSVGDLNFPELLKGFSANEDLKIYVLENVNKISEIFKDNFGEILENLKIFPKLNWRYKKAFLERIKDLEAVGVSKEWVKEELKNDRVFYIKDMIRSMD